MSQDPVDRPADPRADQLRRDQQKRSQRTLIGFALVEGFVLAAAVVAIYVLELIDPSAGVWVLVAIALLSGGLLGTYIMISTQRNQRELTELGEE
ncbi:hypothetical protein H3H54_11750 [Brachybacterium sp. Z12]|uniref:hypothetical protein n=1 Tax=Brachybacterium sp. Z12 TaxID=2759167 RepID=UPI00186155B7|nr:hypothetical protein [Brachybacterium sp. Z12]QNN81940.1 hypothetical protein H3H54_11750 [Brachybacterium sp. Z12]